MIRPVSLSSTVHGILASGSTSNLKLMAVTPPLGIEILAGNLNFNKLRPSACTVLLMNTGQLPTGTVVHTKVLGT